MKRDRPTYEGRPLVRVDEEVVDQGLGFDLQTLANRRQILRAFGLGATVLGLAACGTDGSTSTSTGTGTGTSGTSTSSGEIPDETAGPYPGDGSNGPDVLQQSGIVRSDIRKSFGTAGGTAEGVPMTVELIITDMAGGNKPFAGTAVYLWHCDREGRYSLYSDGVQDQNYLRGVQIADSAGKVRFASIFPACYSGRWPHVHFEAYPDQASITDASKAIATSQIALPKDTCSTVYRQAGYEQSVANLSRVSLQSDNVFGDDGAAHQLGTVTGDVSGYTVALSVPVDTRITATGGGPPGRPGGR